MKYKIIDLCAGIGGIRKGFELTGEFENVLSAEIDDFACATYEHLFGDNPKNDLTSEEFKQKVVDTKYDVLLAGFPCQTFSRAGLQKGFRDTTKGTIFFDIADIISRTHPRAVFLENVENLVSHDKGETLKRIINTLEDELGYRIIGVTLDEDGEYEYTRDSFVRNSRYFGLPQNRPRVYIMAFNKKTYGNAIKLLKAQLPDHRAREPIAEDLKAILEDNVDDVFYMSSGYLETLKKHRVREHAKGHGFGYVVVNEPDNPHQISNTILATGGSGKERNLVRQYKEGVAGKELPTKKSPLNDEGIRVMTPKEWGRLQGFIGYAFMENGKDKFSFPPKTTVAQQYKQFGNSVTIPVIEEMAYFMLSCFETMTKDQLELVVQMASNRDSITRRDVIELLRVSSNQAGYLLRKLVGEGRLQLIDTRKKAHYVIRNQQH